MSSLYRKYRPQGFDQVTGQPQVTTVLSRAIAAGSPAHAYLFAGPRGTGKTSVARIVAKSLNCTNKTKDSAEPCNTCDNCQAIDKGAFLDVLELDAASNRGIDEIRQLKEQVAVSPAMGGYKVYILDEAHMLTDAAFNALLKTLEEPPNNVMFILCTTEVHKIPITIASRCQRLVFKRADLTDLTQQLAMVAKAEKVKIDQPALDLLASLADGGYRDGEMLLEQVMASDHQGSINRQTVEQQLGLANQQVIDQISQYIIEQNVDQLLSAIEQFAVTGGNIRQLTDALLDEYHLLMLITISPNLAKGKPAEQIERLSALAAQANQSSLLRITDSLLEARQSLQHYQGHHQALALETALLEALQPTIVKDPVLEGPKDPKTQGPKEDSSSKPEVEVKSKISDDKPKVESKVEEPESGPEPEVEAQSSKSLSSVVNPPSDLADLWNKILDEIRPQSRSVEALLRDCLPVSFDGTILVLQFWYVFHKNKLDQDKNRQIVEATASQIVGSPVKIETQLGDKSQKPKREPMAVEDIHNVANVQEENLVDAAMEIFGGEIE